MGTTEGVAHGPGPTAATVARSDQRLAGIVLLCTGALVFSLQDVVIKGLSGAYPVAQILAVRSVVAFFALLVMLRLDGGLAGLRTRRLPRHLLRGLFLFLSYTAYYLSVAAIPLAEAVALFYSAPLFIVALSVPLLQERVGLRQWLAVLVGFLGVVVVCRPGFGVLDPAALLPIIAAGAYAVGQVMARDLGRTDRAAVMAFYHNCINITAALVIGLVAGDGAFASGSHASAQFLLRAWVVPTPGDLLLMASTGIVATLGSWCLSNAYRVAAANVVAPFEYSAITWAVMWGFFIWGEVPGPAVALGVAMIVGAGLFILRADRSVR